jgi:ribosomal protein S18 acetylase RimI-like enzyme
MSALAGDIKLRRMTSDDFVTYLAIDRQVGGKTYAHCRTLEEVGIEFSKGPMFLIMRGQVAVGSIYYFNEPEGVVYLAGIAVAPPYQGQGIARAACGQVLEMAKGAPRIWLVTHPENLRAIAMYESLGFTRTGREENFYGDGEPRLVYTREQSGSVVPVY